MKRPERLQRGALAMLGSALFFAGMGLAVKIASRSLPNTTVVFARNAIGLLALLPWAAARLGWRGLATRKLPEHLVRALAGLASMYCFFYAIANMRLADAVLLNYSLPLFMPFIAQLWLGERFPARLWPGLLLGFLGIVLVLKPGSGLFNPIALFALASAALAALAQVGVRRLTESEPVTRIVLYFGAISTALSALPLLGQRSAPAPSLWPLLLTLGALATAAQVLLTYAYAQAPAAQVGPFIYACVPFAAILDGVFLGQWPDAASIAGSLLVILAGTLILRQSRLAALESAASAPGA
jgi:drug/metabolite transporter (DMT)-like permease